jgi:hypothetical protein
VIFNEWQHCGLMTRKVLESGIVRSPTVLYLEQDMWPVGDVPWQGMVRALEHPDVDCIRLSMCPDVIPEHRHLYPGWRRPEYRNGNVPLQRTYAWSQQAHLAKTDWYRDICTTYFGLESRTGLEEVLYVAEVHHLINGIDTGKNWGTWLYCPEGNIQRSDTRDGRQSTTAGTFDSKYSRRISYDGPTPPGAPSPCEYR